MKTSRWAIVLVVAAGAALAKSVAWHQVAALPLVQHWQRFADPNESAFSLDMPQGWKNSGGTFRRNALQYRGWALATSPDGSTIIAVNDPAEPSYIAPTPMLAMAGIGVGRIYNGGGGTTYLVAPYRSGEDYAALWGQRKLASRCEGVRVVSHRARPEIAERINAYSRAWGIEHNVGEATFSCRARGEDMTAYAFASLTYIRGGIWYADTIEAFLAPTPVAGIAAGLLAHMVGSVQVNPVWMQRQLGTEAKVSEIATRTNAEISQSIMQGWEDRGARFDRVMEEGSRARLGIDVYADPATGTKYTVANTHEHYWVNDAGTVVGTDTDTPPGGSFKRLEHVPPQ